MSRVINSNGINLIKHFEGFRKDAYICPAGILTIGYGHTESAKPGQNIDEATAEDLLPRTSTQRRKRSQHLSKCHSMITSSQHWLVLPSIVVQAHWQEVRYAGY